MFILANILRGVAELFSIILDVYMFIVIGRVIISWVDADPRNRIVMFLYRATDPLFRKIRRLMPFVANIGGIDLSPIVVFGIIMLLKHAVVGNLFDLAVYLKMQ